MEKTTKEVIAKLTAEVVNEITFQKGRADSPYNYEYLAEVSVKVGNTVKEIKLEYSKDYDSEGHPYVCRLTNYTLQQFDDIIKAGIEIDFSTVLKEYGVLVEKAKEHEKELKEAQEKIRVEKYKKLYKSCWAVTLRNELYKDKNKTLKAKRDEVIIHPCNEEYFVKHEKCNVVFSYRGFTTGVSDWSGKLEWQNAKENGEHQRINEGKAKRSIHPLTLLLKFIEAVDDFITTREYTNKRDNKALLERRAQARLLAEVTGHPVTILKKREYSKYGRNNSWMSYSYMLVTKLPENEYSEYEGYKISTEIGTSYEDGKHVEITGTRTYSLRGLNKLTEAQFKGILNILLENTEVLKATKKSDKIDS